MDGDQAELLRRIAAGDRGAFQDLYRALERPVFRFIRARLNDPFECHDILHDVFMEIWRHAGRYEGRSKVQTWVMGIAYRKVIDALRRQGRVELPGEDMPETADDAPAGEACLAAGQEAAHVRFCLDHLSGDHRTAVTLAFWEDLSYGEIAEVAGVPEGTVKTRIFHAKKLLLRCLAGRIGGTP
jgi:RNA polymerase sigma-70 factor (ECF subfamily)